MNLFASATRQETRRKEVKSNALRRDNFGPSLKLDRPRAGWKLRVHPSRGVRGLRRRMRLICAAVFHVSSGLENSTEIVNGMSGQCCQQASGLRICNKIYSPWERCSRRLPPPGFLSNCHFGNHGIYIPLNSQGPAADRDQPHKYTGPSQTLERTCRCQPAQDCENATTAGALELAP